MKSDRKTTFVDEHELETTAEYKKLKEQKDDDIALMKPGFQVVADGGNERLHPSTPVCVSLFIRLRLQHGGEKPVYSVLVRS